MISTDTLTVTILIVCMIVIVCRHPMRSVMIIMTMMAMEWLTVMILIVSWTLGVPLEQLVEEQQVGVVVLLMGLHQLFLLVLKVPPIITLLLSQQQKM